VTGRAQPAVQRRQVQRGRRPGRRPLRNGRRRVGHRRRRHRPRHQRHRATSTVHTLRPTRRPHHRYRGKRDRAGAVPTTDVGHGRKAAGQFTGRCRQYVHRVDPAGQPHATRVVHEVHSGRRAHRRRGTRPAHTRLCHRSNGADTDMRHVLRGHWAQVADGRGRRRRPRFRTRRNPSTRPCCLPPRHNRIGNAATPPHRREAGPRGSPQRAPSVRARRKSAPP
jgi:hypothetical protein